MGGRKKIIKRGLKNVTQTSADLGFRDDHTLHSEALVAFLTAYDYGGDNFRSSSRSCVHTRVIKIVCASPEMPLLIIAHHVNSLKC